MTQQPRKAQTNEPGHPGQWGSKQLTAAAVALTPAEADDFDAWAEAGDDNEWAEHPPTKHEVDAAERYMTSLAPRRPMYRGDWQRVNGGTGPTLGQHLSDLAGRNSERDAYQAARDEWQRMHAAWEASDKSQDEAGPEYRCGYCGEWFYTHDGRCPACGNYN